MGIPSQVGAIEWYLTDYESYGLVITCEHGGNKIPVPFRDLFFAHKALLDTHRGFDAGALAMAKALATKFAAPLVISTVSRLLVDLNRSIGHPGLHYETIRNEPIEVRQQILNHYYHPYRLYAESVVRQAIADYGRVLHLSSHSFTPVLNGKVRNADISFLYDPDRMGEVEVCKRWKAALKIYEPNLMVRRNYPYAGKDDGLTSWFRQHLSPSEYVGIELEINQKHIIKAGHHWTELRKAIVESLHVALAKPV